MDKIRTAEEYLREVIRISDCLDTGPSKEFLHKNNVYLYMQSFAKLHVKAALEAAYENGEIDYRRYTNDSYIVKESILEAYPESNIK